MPDTDCPQVEHSMLLSELSLRVDSLEQYRKDTQTLEHRFSELERSVDVMAERTHHYESKIDLMDKSIQILTEKQETLKERMPSKEEWQEIKQGIRELQGKDSKSFNRIKDIVITVILSGAITYFLTKGLEILMRRTP